MATARPRRPSAPIRIAQEERDEMENMLRMVASYFRPFINVDVNCPVHLILRTAKVIIRRLGLNVQFPSSKHFMRKWKTNYLENPIGLSFGITIARIQEIHHPNQLLQRILHPSKSGGVRVNHPTKALAMAYGFNYVQPFMKIHFQGMEIPRTGHALDVVEIGKEGVYLYSGTLVSSMLHGHEKRTTSRRLRPEKNSKAKAKPLVKTFPAEPPPPLSAPRGRGRPRKNPPVIPATTAQNKKRTRSSSSSMGKSRAQSRNTGIRMSPPPMRGRGRPRKIIPSDRTVTKGGKGKKLNVGIKRPRSNSSSRLPLPDQTPVTPNTRSNPVVAEKRKSRPSENPTFAKMAAPRRPGVQKNHTQRTPSHRGKTMRLIEKMNKKAAEAEETDDPVVAELETEDSQGYDLPEEFSFMEELASTSKLFELGDDDIPDPEKLLEHEPFDLDLDFQEPLEDEALQDPEPLDESVNLEILTQDYLRDLEDQTTLPDTSQYLMMELGPISGARGASLAASEFWEAFQMLEDVKAQGSSLQ